MFTPGPRPLRGGLKYGKAWWLNMDLGLSYLRLYETLNVLFNRSFPQVQHL